MTISVVGIDIAKNTFQLHGADSAGKAVAEGAGVHGDIGVQVGIAPVHAGGEIPPGIGRVGLARIGR